MRFGVGIAIACLVACKGSPSADASGASDSGPAEAASTPVGQQVPGNRYIVSEVPAMNGIADLWPTSINSHGDVVGIHMAQPTGPPAAFLFSASSGKTRQLVAEGTSAQFATAINDAGQIVGWVRDARGQQRSVRWDVGGLVDLPALPLSPGNTAALAVGNRGDIVGWSEAAGYWQHAVLWDLESLHDLGTGAALGSAAQGVNRRGIAVGMTFYQVGSTAEWHAAVFEGAGVRELGSIAGRENSFARAINDAGRIVGSSFPTRYPGEWRAFVYDLPNGPMAVVAPDRRCELLAVNNGGMAVGHCVTDLSNGRASRAVIMLGVVFEDLTDMAADPSWVLNDAQGINDAGQITGSGSHDGQPRAYVLSRR
jgi:probable HAF family extracellular repeat protein